MVYLEYITKRGDKHDIHIQEDISFEKWIKYHDTDSDEDNYNYTSMCEKILSIIKHPEDIQKIKFSCGIENISNIDLVRFIEVTDVDCRGTFYGVEESVSQLTKLVNFKCIDGSSLRRCNLMKSININTINCSKSCLFNTSDSKSVIKCYKYLKTFIIVMIKT
jgi:hypothetical protein